MFSNIDRHNSSASGCAVCGAPLVYDRRMLPRVCVNCGHTFAATAQCERGHFLCDNCHAAPAFAVIRERCLRWKGAPPLALANRIMRHSALHMHGPEHHYLVPAVLLTACHTAAPAVCSLPEALDIALERARQVPGGTCGFWGACGGAVGGGIFASVLTGATPLSTVDWGRCTALTARILADLAGIGGPRCCKRAVYVALRAGCEFATQHTPGLVPDLPPVIRCGFFPRNRECKGEACPFYPR